MLTERGAALRVLDLNLDTGTPTGRLLLTVLGGIAQFEREIKRLGVLAVAAGDVVNDRLTGDPSGSLRGQLGGTGKGDPIRLPLCRLASVGCLTVLDLLQGRGNLPRHLGVEPQIGDIDLDVVACLCVPLWALPADQRATVAALCEHP